MKEPFNKPGDVKRPMSRIPFGGSAVLDIGRSPRRKNEGVLSKKLFAFSSRCGRKYRNKIVDGKLENTSVAWVG